MDKYLIVGLGNPGAEYEGTRHNTGFMVLDALAKASNIVFEDKRYGFVAETTLRGRKMILLKPTTFMNLSGNAVRYWMQKENIPLDELMKTWMAKLNDNCFFISAKERENIDELRELLYKRVRELHVQKYPYNDFLYDNYNTNGEIE